jgi:hypothetical protein
MAITKPSLLVQHVSVPALLMKQLNESPADRAQRLSAVAHLVIHVDACCSKQRNGIGFVATNTSGVTFWASFILALSSYQSYDDVCCPVKINLLEFIASVMAVLTLCRSLPPVTTPYFHLHIWTDNTAALSWILKRRSVSPLHGFLLQFMTHLLVQSKVVLTAGHIPGVKNFLADAASRDFNCPNGHLARQQLLDCRRAHPYPEVLQSMLRVSKLPSVATSVLTAEAHTAAVLELGRSSAN